jgi:hypothetical protein
LLSRLSAAQFAEWMAFFKIEPDADSRADYLAAHQLSMLGNIHRKADVEEFEPLDFLPWLKADTPTKVVDSPKIDAKSQNTLLKALFNRKGKS